MGFLGLRGGGNGRHGHFFFQKKKMKNNARTFFIFSFLRLPRPRKQSCELLFSLFLSLSLCFPPHFLAPSRTENGEALAAREAGPLPVGRESEFLAFGVLIFRRSPRRGKANGLSLIFSFFLSSSSLKQ